MQYANVHFGKKGIHDLVKNAVYGPQNNFLKHHREEEMVDKVRTTLLKYVNDTGISLDNV